MALISNAVSELQDLGPSCVPVQDPKGGHAALSRQSALCGQQFSHGHAQSLASVGNNVNFNSLRPGLDVHSNTRAACHSVSSGPVTTDAHSEFGATVLEGYPASLPTPVHNSSPGTHSCVAVRGSIRGYDRSEESEDGSSGYGRENDDDRAAQSDGGDDDDDDDDDGGGGGGDSGDDDGEEQNDRIAQKTSHRHSRSVSQGPLNCPYHKRNKVRFNVREHWKCTKPFANLSNVKSVSADSAQPWPLFVCADYSLECRIHIGKYHRRTRSSDNVEDGITEDIAKRLIARKKYSKISTWESLWKILFPRDVEVPPQGMLLYQTS
ncbi:hypothetical protein VTG60DRAFT_5237 [Thermothelomyces hinnuleus]